MAPALIVLFSLLAAVPSVAQQTKKAIAVTPLSQAAGTVTTGGTFQQVLAANPARSSCSVQNTGTHVGYVWWLGSGSPTLLNSYQLAAGSTWRCEQSSGSVIRTAIQYTTGTTADPFNVADNQ
jgi:hypothetical protein